MFRKLIEFINTSKFYFISETLLNIISKIIGQNYVFKYESPFWTAKTRDKLYYVDYFIDPRQSIEKDVFDLYKDIFFNEYTPKSGDVICNLGAGMGHEIPIFIETIGRDGKMFFVEASPSTFEGLELNSKLHKLSNAKLFNLAISDQDEGKLKISNETENHLGRSILDNTKSIESYEEINQISIDTFISENNIKSIDYLVVNIEGYEANLIKKFEKIECVQNIAISCHDFLHYRNQEEFDERFFTFDMVKAFLLEKGFNVSNRSSGTDFKDFYIYGSRQSSF
jgi:FkbM family methyltransferase